MKTTLISLFRQRRPAQQTVHLQAFTPSALHPILDWPTPPSAHAGADAREGRMRGYTTVFNVEQRLQYRKPQKTGEKSLMQNLELSGRRRKFVVFFIVRPKVDKNWLFGCKPTSAGGLLLFSSLTEEGVDAVVPFWEVERRSAEAGGASGAGSWSWSWGG